MPNLDRRKLLIALVALVAIAGVVLVSFTDRDRAKEGLPVRSFKEQLRFAESYIVIPVGESVRVQFMQPCLTSSDLRSIGIAPTIEKAVEGVRTWILEMRPASVTAKRAPFPVTIRFNGNLVTEIEFPSTLSRFVDAGSLLHYLKYLGHSKIDFAERRTKLPDDVQFPPLAHAFPSRTECALLFGAPDQTSTKGNSVNDVYQLRSGPAQKSLRVVCHLGFHPRLGTFQSGRVEVGGYGVQFSDDAVYLYR